MDFEEYSLGDGEEAYLVYSDDLYDDLDVSPSPSPVPKRKPVKIDFEMDEEDYKRMHDQVRKIQSSFLDDTDALQKASRKSDADALRYVTGLMEKVSVAPVSQSFAPSGRKDGTQIIEVSMPGTEASHHSLPRRHHTFEETEVPDVSSTWRHRKRLSSETVARLNSESRSRVMNGESQCQLSDDTQALIKSPPRTSQKPGKLSAETVALLQANNPRSPFARSQSLKAPRSEPMTTGSGSAARSERRKQIEQKLEGILDYEIPTTDKFSEMRRTLLDVNDKMVEHRILLDKYSSLDMSEPNDVSEEVEHRYNQVIERMPLRAKTSDDKLRSSSLGVTGYGKGLVPNDNQPVTELRGRIRRLLCRSKNNPHYYRF